MARIPLEDTPIYAQLLEEQERREAYLLFFEQYTPAQDKNDG